MFRPVKNVGKDKALETAQRTFVSDELAPPEYKASTLGGFQMAIGLCALPFSLIAGIFWDRISIFMPLYFSLGLTILTSVMLLFVKEHGGVPCQG